MSQLNTSVKECLQRLIKANQRRSRQKDHQRQKAEVKKQDDDDNRQRSSVGSSGDEIEETRSSKDECSTGLKQSSSVYTSF